MTSLTKTLEDGAADAAEADDLTLTDDDELQQERSVIFTVAGGRFHCPVGLVREVVPSVPLTRLPGAPPTVVGLLNARGTIVTVIDLGQELFGVPCDRDTGSIMLLDAGGTIAGMRVDMVSGVRVLEEEDAVTTTALDVRAIVARALVTLEGQ